MRSETTRGEAATDGSLLARIGQKDEEALSTLYDRYGGLVFSEAKRILRDTGAAEEILQELFVQVWQAAERFDTERGSLAGWLLVAARYRSIAKLRGKKRKNEEPDENGVMLSVDVESHAEQSLLLDKVRGRMESLPVSQREVLENAYFGGKSLSEIAGSRGEPVGAVKTRMRNAMEALKQGLR